MSLVQRLRRLEARSPNQSHRHVLLWTAATPWQQVLGRYARPIRRGEQVSVIEIVGAGPNGEQCPKPAEHEQHRAEMRAWLRDHEGAPHGTC